MNKEEFDILVNDILKIPQPKEELTASSMYSINAEELRQVIEAFNKIPDYNILIKDNLKKDKEIKKLNKKYENAVADYEEQKYIIEELEKWLNKYFVGTMSDAVLDKLKELKEGK